MKHQSLPPVLAQDDLDALRKTMAALLEYSVKHRLEELLGAGVTEAELFKLRQIASAYRNDTLNPKHYAGLLQILPKLDAIHISL